MSKDFKVVASSVVYPETITVGKIEKVLDTYKNLEWLLSHFEAEIKYNLMTRRREIYIPDQYVFSDDEANDSLARIEYIATINGMPDKNIDKHLSVIAGENSYHPIVECIALNRWDGNPRLDDFINTLETDNPIIDRQVIKTWMVAAIAAAHSMKGFTNHGVLVLQGEQGLGKTEWVKSLDPIKGKSIKVGVLLEPKIKDSIIGASRFWIIELGELDATFNKADIAHLKSYITSPVDDVRAPWGRCETRLVRRTAYIATVNEQNFLVDNTGNRRWWTISCKAINYEHGFDMQQVWAEVYDLWMRGAPTYLPHELQRTVNASNQEHEKIHPLKEKLLTWYDWDSPHRKELSVSAILEELGYPRPTLAEVSIMGKILVSINEKQPRRTKVVRLHEVPTVFLRRNQSII